MEELYKKYNLKNEEKVIEDLKSTGRSFEVHRTSYTSIVKVKNKRVIFNNTGEPEKDSLKLLNKVRSDAQEYLKKTETPPQTESADIKWYFFNDVVGHYTNPYGDCIKLDLNSAYWSTAIKEGVISKKTSDLFEYYSKNLTRKEAKQLRLKALGSLASKKQVYKYNKGRIEENYEKTYSEHAKHLYLYICKKVSDIMEDLTIRFRQPYMYWDLIVITNKSYLENIKNELIFKGYDFKIEFATYEIIQSLAAKNFIAGGISYPIKQTDLTLE